MDLEMYTTVVISIINFCDSIDTYMYMYDMVKSPRSYTLLPQPSIMHSWYKE